MANLSEKWVKCVKLPKKHFGVVKCWFWGDFSKFKIPNMCYIFFKKVWSSRISSMTFPCGMAHITWHGLWHIPVCPPIQLDPKFMIICWRSVPGSSGTNEWTLKKNYPLILNIKLNQKMSVHINFLHLLSFGWISPP